MEPMTIWLRVWAVAADDTGGGTIWKLGGLRPFEDGPVYADNSIDALGRDILSRQGIVPIGVRHGGDLLWWHSTSWSPDGPRQWDNYIAVVHVPSGRLVQDRWPDALPVAPELLEAVGNPPPCGPCEEPAPRTLDTMFHGLKFLRDEMLLQAVGHVKNQIRENATTRAALAGTCWAAALEPFEETLPGLYQFGHAA
jgi:hypothetical protein